MPGFLSRLLGWFSGSGDAPTPAKRRPPARTTAPARTPSATPTRPAPKPVVPDAALATAPATPAPALRQHSEALDKFVASVHSLPLFSGTAMLLMQSVGREDVSNAELARLISTEAGITAGLLRIVNSSFYGLSTKISTVHDAIAVMGMNQVRRTVLAAVSQRPVAQYLKDSKVVRAFWRHLLLTAAMSRHLARQNGLDGEVAYTAGLMHEMGRLAMLIQHPHLDNLLLHVEGDHDGLGIDRERAHFGFDHAQVGGALLEHWGLPSPIAQAAWDHGGNERPEDPMSAAVWRANLLAHDMIDKAEDLAVETPWMQAVGLSIDDRRKMLGEIEALEAGQR